MKAYATFAGGGVKGAALAGCLTAAQEMGIEFEGYGGVSAGSIVALLGSVGMSGKEIFDLMLANCEPKKTLDDNGKLLTRLTRSIELIKQHWRDEPFFVRPFHIAYDLIKLVRCVYPIYKHLGLYNGDKMVDILYDVLARKYPSIRILDKYSVSFSDLVSYGAKPLKMVVSDLRRRRAVYVPHENDNSPPNGYEITTSVLQSVRSSSGFPFVFRPSSMLHNKQHSHFSDGGLACNLPIFLFDREAIETQYPILAFDLVTDGFIPNQGKHIWNMISDMFNTSLEASLDILVNIARKDHLRIPVSIPSSIHTLLFDLDSNTICELYERGYNAAKKVLSNYDRLSIFNDANGNLQRQVQARYVMPNVVAPALAALSAQVEQYTRAKNVRAVVMLPTGKTPNTRIVSYHYGMRADDHDHNLELNYDAGGTGAAIRTRTLVIVDLERVRSNPEEFGVSPEQNSLIPLDRKSLACFPIVSSPSNKTENRVGRLRTLQILGTISVDSSSSLLECGWQNDDNLVLLMRDWSAIFAKILCT